MVIILARVMGGCWLLEFFNFFTKQVMGVCCCGRVMEAVLNFGQVMEVDSFTRGMVVGSLLGVLMVGRLLGVRV